MLAENPDSGAVYAVDDLSIVNDGETTEFWVYATQKVVQENGVKSYKSHIRARCKRAIYTIVYEIQYKVDATIYTHGSVLAPYQEVRDNSVGKILLGHVCAKK